MPSSEFTPCSTLLLAALGSRSYPSVLPHLELYPGNSHEHGRCGRAAASRCGAGRGATRWGRSRTEASPSCSEMMIWLSDWMARCVDLRSRSAVARFWRSAACSRDWYDSNATRRHVSRALATRRTDHNRLSCERRPIPKREFALSIRLCDWYMAYRDRCDGVTPGPVLPGQTVQNR